MFGCPLADVMGLQAEEAQHLEAESSPPWPVAQTGVTDPRRRGHTGTWSFDPGTGSIPGHLKNQRIKGDVRDYEAVFKACEGVDCVFHVASYGISGSERVQSKKLIESINVGGTRVVISVCQQRNISRLIYTSSVNVVFGGNPIEEGDEETVPYYPLEKHTDHYSRTKAIADQMILAADGTPLKGGDRLRTCVIRPPGIYGPEEQRHLPRVARNIQRQLFSFQFWSRDTLMNWVHVHNLVQGHLLASAALTAERGYIASGQAYYIHDGESIVFAEWIALLFEKLGCKKPRMHMPALFVHVAAALLEYLHLLLKPVCNFTPIVTRTEVRNLTVTHTFRIDKARKQLGYHPKKFTLADTVDHYLKTRPPCQDPAFSPLLVLTFGVVFSVIVLSFLF
ncbi:putative short-chain dehydrogenase/reductase family 42E member 2 isoform X2 [Paroedura picta]|uniref:putative short-chain dehydrogenase/reductase family 42E member 2 isoform X2 n=1 Tax=Paroedura picta TaxID=143630 RepID=UPI0040578563